MLQSSLSYRLLITMPPHRTEASSANLFCPSVLPSVRLVFACIQLVFFTNIRVDESVEDSWCDGTNTESHQHDVAKSIYILWTMVIIMASFRTDHFIAVYWILLINVIFGWLSIQTGTRVQRVRSRPFWLTDHPYRTFHKTTELSNKFSKGLVWWSSFSWHPLHGQPLALHSGWEMVRSQTFTDKSQKKLHQSDL